MNFKEALAWEAENVFCNPDEFAEAKPAILNGVACIAQVIGPRTAQSNIGENRDGVSFETAVIHIAAGHIPLPLADRELTWNGTTWIVSEAADTMGMYRIELYRERS